MFTPNDQPQSDKTRVLWFRPQIKKTAYQQFEGSLQTDKYNITNASIKIEGFKNKT